MSGGRRALGPAAAVGLALGALLLAPEQPATGAGRDDAERLEELADEVRRLRAELAELRAENEELRAALERAHADRAAREMAWYEYNRALATLEVDDVVPRFPVDPEHAPDEPEPEPDAAAELERKLAERAQEIETSLRHFLMLEEIRGIDLLEVGRLDAGGIGPVVFRLLDDRGRLAGGLSAERMRLEASRSGHLVTLVLENGFESRAGERIPFEGGVRRIVLPYVDPEPWIESFPELFPGRQTAPPLDDGRHDLDRLAREVTELLRLAAEPLDAGRWRLDRVDGVLGDTFSMVQLAALDEAGRLERRVFADRMTVAREGDGVRLSLRDGVIVRPNARSPFVDGVFRIYLPRADADAWVEAGVPGLADGE